MGTFKQAMEDMEAGRYRIPPTEKLYEQCKEWEQDERAARDYNMPEADEPVKSYKEFVQWWSDPSKLTYEQQRSYQKQWEKTWKKDKQEDTTKMQKKNRLTIKKMLGQNQTNGENSSPLLFS